MSIRETAAAEIRAAMARNQQSRRGLAEALSCSPGHAGKLANGLKPLTTDQLEIIADFLHVSVADLVEPKEAHR